MSNQGDTPKLGEFTNAMTDPETFKSFVERYRLTNERVVELAGELTQLTFRRLWELHHKDAAH